jgi:hypothetical protein
MKKRKKIMNLHDVELFELTTKKVMPFEKIEVKRINYVPEEFFETSKKLTYKVTGEKYKVMAIKGGYFETKVINEFKGMSLSFADDDTLDKAFTKLALSA